MKNTYPCLSILVLDNASTDGSVEAIRQEYPDVEVCSLQENKGYNGNNNVGIQKALDDGADWVFILNEDTTLSEECISHLVQAGESDPKIGIVGPLVYHYYEPGIIQSAGVVTNRWWRSTHIGSNEEDNHQYDLPRTVDWLTGCSILVRRQVFEQIGGFDETFFYYNEETDLCYRARQAGWKVLYVPQGKVWHKGVQREYHPSSTVTYYSIRNHLMFLAKHNAPWYVSIVNWLMIARTLTSWTVRPKL
jgi:GT2 family glycosyltransferase